MVEVAKVLVYMDAQQNSKILQGALQTFLVGVIKYLKSEFLYYYSYYDGFSILHGFLLAILFYYLLLIYI